jgi:hypothetical protein
MKSNAINQGKWIPPSALTTASSVVDIVVMFTLFEGNKKKVKRILLISALYLMKSACRLSCWSLIPFLLLSAGLPCHTHICSHHELGKSYESRRLISSSGPSFFANHDLLPVRWSSLFGLSFTALCNSLFSTTKHAGSRWWDVKRLLSFAIFLLLPLREILWQERREMTHRCEVSVWVYVYSGWEGAGDKVSMRRERMGRTDDRRWGTRGSKESHESGWEGKEDGVSPSISRVPVIMMMPGIWLWICSPA